MFWLLYFPLPIAHSHYQECKRCLKSTKHLNMPEAREVIPDRPVEVPLPKTYRAPEGEIGLDDEMLTLYQNITMHLPDVTRPVVMFIGSHSNEGTSTVARQLAKTASLRLTKIGPSH